MEIEIFLFQIQIRGGIWINIPIMVIPTTSDTREDQ